MRRIAKPELTAEEIVTDCISNMQDENLKAAISASLPRFQEAHDDFEAKISTNELFKIEKAVVISEAVNASVLKDIYNSRMLNKKNPGRKHYESLLSIAPRGKCPYCDQRIASTLDHFLPKSDYPLFSVTPVNLIPSCSDCNTGKRIESPTSNEDETLHPYYDNVEDSTWLKSKIVGEDDAIFNFYVSPPEEWPDLLIKRVKNHFECFNLNTLYAIHAAEEFHNIKLTLTNLFNAGGPEAIYSHLDEAHQSRKANNLNSWRTACYQAMMDCDRLLEGHYF